MGRRPVRAALTAFALFVAPGAARAGPDGIVACDDFKAGWQAALRQVEPARPALAYGAPSGPDHVERVTSMPDLQASVSCRDGFIGQVELKQGAGDPAKTIEPLLRVGTSVLMAFDRQLGFASAGNLLAALRADAKPGGKSVSSWEPYELSYIRSADRSGDQVVLVLVEN